MAIVEFILDVKDQAYLNANPTKVLSLNEPIYINDGRYAYGDGVTELQNINFFGTATDPKLREEFTIPAVANSSVTLSYIPVFVWGVYLNGLFLLSSEYTIASGVITIIPGTGGDLAIVYSHNNVVPPTPSTYGDLFVEDFNPQVGTYVDDGSIVKVITAGNMALSGGNGFFYNNTILQDVVWNGNNWYFECEYEITTSNLNNLGPMFGLQSITGGQPQSVFFGLYYFNANNSTAISLFGANPNLGQIAPESASLTATAGDRLKVRAEFVESVITVIATNMTNPNTVSLNYTFDYTLAVNSNRIKPNTGKLLFLPSDTVTNIKSYKFGTKYDQNVNRMFLGDSITSGYFSNAEANKYQNLYASSTGNSIATMAGAGDRSIELANTNALSYYTLLNPAKVHILIGTNDVANGVSLATIQANITAIISAFQAVGSQIFIGTLLPRNAQNNLPVNAFINGLVGVTVIDYYTAMEDPLNPGDIDPAFSDDQIHPNVAGNIEMKNLLIASGF